MHRHQNIRSRFAFFPKSESCRYVNEVEFILLHIEPRVIAISDSFNYYRWLCMALEDGCLREEMIAVEEWGI